MLGFLWFGAPTDVPVDPDAPEATEWLIEELSKAPYQAAQPTLFDRVAQAIWDWINSLQFGGAQGPPALGLGVIIALVVAALVVAFLVFGVPRLNRKSGLAGALFGDDDDRTAARIREAAEDAAARQDFSTAVLEMFRSIARGLAERTILTTSPGTTAHGFGGQAGRLFPSLGDDLAQAATAFDDVRYLDKRGSREQYQRIASLEKALRTAKPQLETVSA